VSESRHDPPSCCLVLTLGVDLQQSLDGMAGPLSYLRRRHSPVQPRGQRTHSRTRRCAVSASLSAREGLEQCALTSGTSLQLALVPLPAVVSPLGSRVRGCFVKMNLSPPTGSGQREVGRAHVGRLLRPESSEVHQLEEGDQLFAAAAVSRTALSSVLESCCRVASATSVQMTYPPRSAAGLPDANLRRSSESSAMRSSRP
jgi:hypothetical protein